MKNCGYDTEVEQYEKCSRWASISKTITKRNTNESGDFISV